MFKNVREYCVRLLLTPLLAYFRVQSAIELAECKSEALRRADQADADQQPELARQLREFAASLCIDTKLEEQVSGLLPTPSAPALPAPSTNGHSEDPMIRSPKRGRPRKEPSNETPS